ncbi:MAG: hypothetical protein QNJ75_12765 [Acidimicrobiia bacterium]|nr:hypothetical protein [Acidimicrobiia bacterium]
MTSREHTIAVGEPTLDGEMPVEYARQALDRGGAATVILLIGKETVANINAFARSEDLSFPDGREIYLERIAEMYSEILSGRDHVTIVADGPDANKVVFDRAAVQDATSVVVPQRLVNRRNWKSSVAKSTVPVVVAPPKAA